MTRSSRLAFAAGFLLLASAIAARQWGPALLSDTVQGLLFGLAVGLLLMAALKGRLPETCDAATPALRRRYLREFAPAMAGYVLLLFVSVWLLKRVEGDALRALVALLPVPPVALAMRAIMRYIRDSDEMQRRIELEAVSFATALVSLGYLAAGFLQSASVVAIPAAPAMIWVFPTVCLVYGLAKLVISRRYR